MRMLLLSAGEDDFPAAGAGETAVFWNRLDVPPGALSVPGHLTARLTDIRRELLAWVHDLGRARVGGREVQEHLRCGDDLSMWWCSLLFEKHPKVTPALYSALKLRALERLAAEHGCTAIRLHGGDAALHVALRHFCAATGREFSRHSAAETPPVREDARLRNSARRLYHALPGPCKAALRFAAWLWGVKRLLPRVAAPRPQEGGATIATYFPNVDAEEAAAGRFRSRYWESLHDALAEEGAPAVNWLFIGFPSPQYTFRQCLALRDAFAAQNRRDAFHYLEEFLGAEGIWRAARRYARLALAARRLEKHVRPLFRLADSHMDLWPYLGQYWKDSFGGWRALERCLHREGMSAFVRWAGRQRWTIFPMENCPWERMLTHAVRAAGHGPVYGMQHSTVRPTDFRYFDDARTFTGADAMFQPDKIYGNGQAAYREMLAAGTPPDRLGVAEALRYMYLAGSVGSAHTPAPPSRLLAATGFFADEAEEHIRVLARWMALPGRIPLEVCVKPHPYLAVEPYLERYFPKGDGPRVLQEPLAALLKPGVAVWGSNSTTATLEAALMGLPVLAQLPVDGVDLCPLQGVEGVARISSAPQAEEALRRAARARLEPGYLALDPALPRWRDALGLRQRAL